VPRADLPSSVLWHNRQTESRLVLRHKPRNHRSDFAAQITKLKLPVLRSKPVNCHGDFDIQITKSENLTILVLRLNQETRAPRFYVHVIDHTRCYPTSRSSDHRVPDLCLIIINPLHQVSYSCHDPHHCLPCRTYNLHTMRPASTILHMNKGTSVEPRKCLGFKFKPLTCQ
jgi:hypothetical protein